MKMARPSEQRKPKMRLRKAVQTDTQPPALPEFSFGDAEFNAWAMAVRQEMLNTLRKRSGK